ncbi:MAG: FecR family protein [Planctomycetaceae bacterium]
MRDSHRSELPDEWSDLLNAMAEETLTDEQERRLADLLRSDSEFRLEYVRLCQLQTLLAMQSYAAAEPSQQGKPPPNRRIPVITRRTFRLTAAVMSIVAVVIVIGFLSWGPGSGTNSSLGEITGIVGQVEILRDDQPPTLIRADDLTQTPLPLQPGDTIRTDRKSSATFILSDRTEIGMHPETTLILTVEPPGHLTMPRGHATARVTPQKPGHALIFVTPRAEVRVLGTELELLALADHTEVAVKEGRVRVTRISDRHSVDVSAAEFLLIAQTGDLTIKEWPRPPDDWSENFEQGLPRGWTGRFVHDVLPAESHGAAQAVPMLNPQGRNMDVASPSRDTGLFSWQADSVLHATLKVQPPAWLHIYVYARTYGQSQEVMTYCCVNPDLWQSSRGEWRTVHIPLSEFQRVNVGQVEQTLGRIPTRVVFSGPIDHVGVTVDRVWVDRHGSPVTGN